MTLTFRLQICSYKVTIVQRYVSHQIGVSTAFLFLRKSEALDGRTDGRGRGATRRLTRPLGRVEQ